MYALPFILVRARHLAQSCRHGDILRPVCALCCSGCSVLVIEVPRSAPLTLPSTWTRWPLCLTSSRKSTGCVSPCLGPRSLLTPNVQYRFRSLEAHYTLNASFPLSHASNYLAHLSKSPLDIVRTFDALAETHAPVRRQRGELPPPPQLETVRFVHTADAVQHFCLRSERHIQRIYGPVFNRLSSLPGKIEDGSFAKQWVSTSEKVYERIASGEILRVGGKAMAQAVSWMGSGVGRAAAHVKAQITGSEEPPSSL